MALSMFILISSWVATQLFLRYSTKIVHPLHRFIAFDTVHECVYIPLIQATIFAGLLPRLVANTNEFALAFGMLIYASVMRYSPSALTTALNVQPWGAPANGLERVEDHLERGQTDRAAQVLITGPFMKFGFFWWYAVLAWGTYRAATTTGTPWIGLAAHAGLNTLLCLVCLVSGRIHIHERETRTESE